MQKIGTNKLMRRRFISLIVLLAFLLNSGIAPIRSAYAQSAFVSTLPEPGMMVARSASFVPVLLKGMVIYPDNPLRFDFIVDSGNTKFTPDAIKEESNRLVKYFLAAMTVPQDDLWVNLSPYEADRIIPDALGRTDLGRDMLAQDYILKQMSASLLDPEKNLGKEFWARVYRQAQEKFGVSEVPVDTFNKVWIMPEEATVYEQGNAVYVTQSRLKVMLDLDYKAIQINKENSNTAPERGTESASNKTTAISSQIIREIILPEISREVNEGKNFAIIRQVYQALILAKWYKETIKQSFLSKVYIDQKKIIGVDLSDSTIKDQIYGRYVAAFKKGVVNLIKEDLDQSRQEVIPRKYFSGGEVFGRIPLKRTIKREDAEAAMVGDNYRLGIQINPQRKTAEYAMSSSEDISNNSVEKGFLKNTKAIDWLINRVERRTGLKIGSDLRSKIMNLFDQRPLRDLLSLHSEFFLDTDDEKERLVGLVIQEAVLFYNFAVDYNNERTPLDVGIDKDALDKMAQARKAFKEKLPEFEEKTRRYWEEELPRYKGESFQFNEALAAENPNPKVSIAIISMVGRRFDALLRRLEELSRTQVNGGIELVIAIPDPENFTSERQALFRQKVESVKFPVKVIYSKRAIDGEMNSITIDRNLCSSVSTGAYQVFIDDDVRLVGPVIENLIQTLEDYPEIGITSIANYNKKLGMLKPIYPRKYFLDDRVMITDRVLGNITATRREIVKVTPFNPLLRNLGDDQHLVRQILLLGFFGAYVLPEDAYAMDENLGYSATRNNQNLAKHLVEEGLKFYFSPETYDEWQAAPAGFLTNKWSKKPNETIIAYEFWGRFRRALLAYLNSKDVSFNFIEKYPDDEYIDLNRDEIQKAVRYYEENKNRILAFKSEQYDAKNLAGVDPSRGPLTFEAVPVIDDNGENEILDISRAAGSTELGKEGFNLALQILGTRDDVTGLLQQLSKVDRVEKVEWKDGVLTITCKTQVLKFHPKNMDINERGGLIDRFYLKPFYEAGDYGPIIRQKLITRDDARSNQDRIYLFGDNLEGKGLAGQAAALRGEPNAVGIPTKKKPSNTRDAFFSDEEFEQNKKAIDEAIQLIPKGKTIVIPVDGLGTGRALLPQKAPKTFAYLQEALARLEKEQIVVKAYHRDVRDDGRRNGKPVYVLGVVRDGHDSVASLVKDGVLVGAIEEERLNLDKHSFVSFPKEATRYLLKAHGITWEDIDHVAVSFDYNMYRDTPSSKAPHFYYRKKHHLPFKESYLRFNTDQYQTFMEEMALENGTGYIPPVTFVKHHKSHAAAAYFASGFTEPTLVLTIDGQGEDESTAAWVAKNGKFRKIARTTPFTQSLGHFYHIFTVYLGYKRNDEGKVMGYAPYGAPQNADEEKTVADLRALMKELIWFNPITQQIEMNQQDVEYTKVRLYPWVKLSESFQQRLGRIVPPMREGTGRDLKPEDRSRAHLAFVMQERVEQVISDMVSFYLRDNPETKGIKYVAIAGGLGLNIAANGQLVKTGVVDADKLFVPAYPADDGTAIGAALSVSDEEYRLAVQNPVTKISFGKTYSDEEIKRTLDRFGLVEDVDYERIGNDGQLVREVADAIVADKTVAWVQGGAELGPRALGNRSILNRLNDPKGNLKVNRIKGREAWRPSALSIQQERAAEFLDGVSTSPFMTIAFSVTAAKKDVIKAGAHSADGTTRPQTVAQEANPLYWALLGELGLRTDVPGVLNTSFNKRGPIVETPEDALNTYYYGEGLDQLAMGHFLIKRKDHLTPSLLNGSDEAGLKDLFVSGKYKSDPLSAPWDMFWANANHLVASRSVAHQQYLKAYVEDGYQVREILRVPLIKEMFQSGLRESVIADLARRAQKAIGHDGPVTISIETTAPQFQDVVVDLFKRLAPNDIKRDWNIVNLGLADRAPPVSEPVLVKTSEAVDGLNKKILQWKAGTHLPPVLVAVTGTDIERRRGMTDQIQGAFVIYGTRWDVEESERNSTLQYPFSYVRFNEYANALKRLRQGQTAMVPLRQKRLAGLPYRGFALLTEEEKKAYQSILVKQSSRLWVKYDGQLFEEIIPEPSDVFIVSASFGLRYPAIRGLFEDTYYLATPGELEDVSAGGNLAASLPSMSSPLLAEAPFSSKIVEVEKAMETDRAQAPWLSLNAPQAVKKFRYIAIGLTNFCPVQCAFCFMRATPSKAKTIALDSKAIDRVLSYAKSKKIYYLDLGGGEPMTELASVVKIIREAEVERIGIFTSGYFAVNAAATEKALGQISEALKDRERAGKPAIQIDFKVSVDEFHARVPRNNIENIIRAFEKYGSTAYTGMSLILKGALTAKDPIPDIIQSLGGHIIDSPQKGNYPEKSIILSSGYKFHLRYGEVKLMDDMLETPLAEKSFHKGYEKRLNEGELLMETNDVHLSVSYDGQVSLHEYLVKALPIANANEDSFAEDVDKRLTLDPFVVALRTFGMKTIFDIASRARPDIIRRSIAANNNFLAVTDILNDEVVRNYVYRELITLIEGSASAEGKSLPVAGNRQYSGHWEPMTTPHPVHHFDNILLALTDFCPVGCAFCWARAIQDRKKGTRLSAEAIDKMLNYTRKHPVSVIDLTGGEALTEMETVLKIIREADVERISISTSGYFATNEERAEQILDQLAGALREREAAGKSPVKIDFRVSADEFHWHFSSRVLPNIIRAFEKFNDSKFKDILFEVRGMLTSQDPLPDFIESMEGQVKEDQSGRRIPIKAVVLPSGYSFNIQYQEMKLVEELLGTDVAKTDFDRIYPEKISRQPIFIGSSNTKGGYIFVNNFGGVSLHAFLSRRFNIANVNDANFEEQLAARLTSDPLVVALRELGVDAILDIASRFRPNIRERSLAANNMFMAVTDILEDEELRKYVYQELIRLFESKTGEQDLLEKLRQEVYVIGDGQIKLGGPGTVKGNKSQIRFQGDDQKNLSILIGEGFAIEDGFVSLRSTQGPARVDWWGDTLVVNEMNIGKNVKVIRGGEIMNVPKVGDDVEINGSFLIEMDEEGVGDRTKILGNSEARLSSIGSDVIVDQQSKIFKSKVGAGARIVNASLIGGQDELVGGWRQKDDEGKGRGVVIGRGAELRNGLAHHKGTFEGKVNPIIVADGVKLDGVFLVSERNEGIAVTADLELKPGQRVYIYDGVTVDKNVRDQVLEQLVTSDIVKVRIEAGVVRVEGISGSLGSSILLNVTQLKDEYAVNKTRGIPKIFSINTIQDARDLNAVLQKSDVFISRAGKILMSKDGKEDVAVRISQGTFVYPGVAIYAKDGRTVDINVWDLGNRGGALIIADERDVHLGPRDRLAGRVVAAVVRDVNVDAEFNNFGGIADTVVGNAKVTIRNQGVLINANLSSDKKGRGEIIWGGYQGKNVDIEVRGDINVGLSQGGIIEGQVIGKGLNSIKLSSGFNSGYRVVIRDERREPVAPIFYDDSYNPVDSAMMDSQSVAFDYGGIDLNGIKVHHQGPGIDIKFDPVMMQDILSEGIDGFAPVIIELTPIHSVLPILGFNEPVSQGAKDNANASQLMSAGA